MYYCCTLHRLNCTLCSCHYVYIAIAQKGGLIVETSLCGHTSCSDLGSSWKLSCMCSHHGLGMQAMARSSRMQTKLCSFVAKHNS